MHLYFHVPFCARRCSYCDFAIAVRARTPDAEYLEAIRRELDHRRADPLVAAAAAIRTLYLGGGTPSRLDPGTVASLVALARGVAPLEAGAEVTLEANPDDVSEAKAAGWLRAGVTRVSLGVQSHQPEVLAWMHRTHRAEQVGPAVTALRSAGIEEISLDLIFALPPEVPRDWRADLDATLALEPAHLSLYGLTVEPRTPLARWVARGAAREAPEERYAEEYLEADERLRAAGFLHYEVSNFGRPGHLARHNTAYWSGADYLGLGPGAHSLLGGVRSWNVREWVAYRGGVKSSGGATAGSESLTADQHRLERRYLELRTAAGTPRAGIGEEVAATWERAGWAHRSADRLVLTPQGWLRLDALVTQLPHP